MTKRIVRSLAACTLLLTVWAPWGGGSSSAEAPPKVGLVNTDRLGGAERFLTHVSTDKPIYREGETLYVRGVVLDAARHTPIANGAANATIEIKGPKGDTVASGNAVAQDSVLAFQWRIPEGTAGGQYTVKVAFPWQGHAPAERGFEVREYRAPRLKSQIVFVRDGYGPGDAVQASLHTERAEGGIPGGAKVSISARVDGTEVHRSVTNIDAQGNCGASFDLPKTIARGDGTIVFAIEDGGVVETATKTIPILLQTLDLAFYPEGGELVAGLPTRVYVEARTPAQKPADLVGIVVDAAGSEVATVRTEHEGRGRFTFTPKRGETYKLKVSEPAGIATTFALPTVKEAGAAISTASDIIAAGHPARLLIGATSAGEVTVTISQREKVLATKKLAFKKSRFWQSGLRTGKIVEQRLDLPKDASGVLVATVWDAKGAPLAERLIFRAPTPALHVEVQTAKARYATGDLVELTVRARDAAGKPTAALVGLTVTDESVLEMLEKREQAPRLPVMVFLENEVRELADAHVYLDPQNRKAPLAVDLLLGTQGWRRFALTNLDEFLAKHGDAGRRAVAMRTPPPQPEPAQFERSMARDDEAPMAMEMDAPMAAAVPRAAPVPQAPGRAPSRPAQPVREARAAKAPAPPAVASAPAPMAGKMEAFPDGGGVAGKKRALARRERRPRPAHHMAWVRIYAHPHQPNRPAGERNDFAETIFWAAALPTDAKSGEAKVTFALSDTVTAFRIMADAFDARGAITSATGVVSGIQPFYAEPKLPLEVSSHDVIELPVALVNATSSALQDAKVRISSPAPLVIADAETRMSLGPDSRQRRLARIEVGAYVGETTVTLDADGGNYSDKVTRPLSVRPLGFPQEVARGGTLSTGGVDSFDVDLPQTVVSGSIVAEAAVFPSPLANMTQALERLIREPSGCFEQTSSTNYPLVMAQQYFVSHSGVDPALIERSRGLLQKGYNRLVGFECKGRGYEWFGEDPGHEALTAYGLLQFTDMTKLLQVDGQMLTRTRSWLLDRRDKQGGFTHERRALHTWLVDQDLHNGYITWAMLESGERGIEREAKSFVRAAEKSPNSYVTALGANVASLSGDTVTARSLMSQLASKQTSDGRVDGGSMSIVGSRGDALQIETTSLATLAWLRDPAFAANTERSVKWLSESCKGGRYGSTQSTVLALRAIVAYDRAHAKPKAPGSVQLLVDGNAVGEPVPIDTKAQGALALPSFAAALSPGRHRVELKMTGGAPLPFTMAVRYNAEQPESSADARVAVQTALKDTRVREGDVTEIAVTVRNLTDKVLPTPIAIIGVPGGLEVRHDQLKELKKAGRIAAYEVRGREVVLYWRELTAHAVVELPVSLVAAVPGRYTGPASRAYEYYADEFKRWAPGLRAEITALVGK